VQEDIAHHEYCVSVSEDGLQAPNRAHNLRTTFGAQGIEVVPRAGKGTAPAWRFAWETSRFGRPGRMQEVPPSAPSSEGARVTYRREGWSEWYENRKEGLEQGFTIERRPAGEGPLRIVGRVPGALASRARADGAVDFIDGHGACVIRYGDLHVEDAKGRQLPARLTLAESSLAIEVDDGGASYPLAIDPLMTSPAWTADGGQPGASFGTSVATAGDVNGDGYSDVIVGAYVFDNGQANEGRAFVYHGSASGLAAVPAWTAEGDQEGAAFGVSVATAGDVNGDGFSDVIAGAHGYDNGQLDEGRAFVYHGSAAGLASAPSWTAEADDAGAAFGISVATAGDVNGDGYSDVIVGAYLFDSFPGPDVGEALVYHGSASGLMAFPSWIREGDQAGDRFGVAVATAGDVNGDGCSDVIVGADFVAGDLGDEGRTYVYHGSPGGLNTTPGWTADGEEVGARFGSAVATAGDVNGDGYADVVVGAYGVNNLGENRGEARVYHGSAGGLGNLPAWIIGGGQNDMLYGYSVAPAGDVNGDGYSDVIVGAPLFDGDQVDEGRAHAYLGSPSGLGSPSWFIEGDQASAFFGISVATAGDVNGDGYSDVIIGAYGFDGSETNEGRAFVYHGSAAGLAAASAWTEELDQADANFGASVATAGDVNGDGYSDVIVGVPYFDYFYPNEGWALVYHGSAAGLSTNASWFVTSNQAYAEFGSPVATAGDVNGDGFSDVVVGAAKFDAGESDEGRVYVYHGSAAGLASTPAWTAEGNQEEPRFGSAVGSAGDVNGDGYSDVVVGAYLYNGDVLLDVGRALVYHGSAAGLATTPAWIAESNQSDSAFGFSVSTAGDVNGDGFGDVAVGACRYGNGEIREGRAFVYHGSAVGLAALPAWTAESDQAEAIFGASVATAGDVNGDGYSDVIVGALEQDGGEIGEGYAFVYHGSAAGLSSVPDWFGEGGQEEAAYGFPVATAGDVNGDGYSDVIVGATGFDNGEYSEGRAFLYQGSAAGLSYDPAWTAESNQTAAYFGFSAGTAGDVNGDGISDVVVGAPHYSNGESDEGRAFLYYGNNGGGFDRIPQQARTDDSAPIYLLGRSDSESAFLLKALGRTAAGRERVRLQFEVKFAGVPFDGTGLVTGPAADTGTPDGNGSAVPLSELASGLVQETLYHWRLRIASDSPFFPWSPWLSLPYNARSEADVRTAEGTTAVSDGTGGPRAAVLLGASVPNPFRSATELPYVLPHGGQHRLAIYDVQGREVAVLAEGVQSAGRHTLRWEGRDASGAELPTGVYFLRLETAGQVEARRLVIAR
jgi:hypothetical protein